MPIKLLTPESGALRRRLREISAAVDPRSRKVDRLRTEIKKRIVADNEDKLYRNSSEMAGVDRFGKPLAKPAKSTVKNYERHGLVRQVLAPHGLASRAITKFFVSWEFAGGAWRAVVGWKDIPWLIYHLQGCAKGSNPKRPNWSLPKRDIGGISPKGWVSLRAEFARFARNLARRGS